MAFQEIEGNKFYYELENENEKEVIAFFNGVMMSVSSWAFQTNSFKNWNFKLLLHDFKGQLMSDKPEGPYTFADHAREAKLLMDSLDIKKVHIVGTSYGGEVAMQFAIDYPDMVKSIVVIDSVSELDELLRISVERWKFLAKTKNPTDFFWGMAPDVYGSKYFDENKKVLNDRAEKYKEIGEDFYYGQIQLYDTFFKLNITKDLKKK